MTTESPPAREPFDIERMREAAKSSPEYMGGVLKCCDEIKRLGIELRHTERQWRATQDQRDAALARVAKLAAAEEVANAAEAFEVASLKGRSKAADLRYAKALSAWRKISALDAAEGKG